MRAALIQTFVWLCLIAAILFVGSGDAAWSEAWLFLAETAVSSAALIIALGRHDPALLRERTGAPWHRDQAGWDRFFLPIVFAAYLGWMVMMALDARRFAWSHMPTALEAVGAILIPASIWLTWLAFRHNSFAVPQARIQADRGQRVIDDGPYAVVRHPMYSAAILYFVGMPLLLGSWLGLCAAPLLSAALAVRILGEERMLRRELPGYDAYATRVRTRLVPGIW